MFCQKCGAALADTAAVCTSCSAPTSQPAAAATSVAAETVKAASKEAFGALKLLAGNPVAGLPKTYADFGDAKALRVGVAFGVASIVCFLLGGYLLLPYKEGLFSNLGFGGVMKSLLFAAMPFLCTAAGGSAMRKVLGSPGGGLGGDCFISGAAVLLPSITMVLSGLLGYGNYSISFALATFAGCISILTLFSGLTRISRLTERAGTAAVPIVVLLSAWLTKTIMVSILTPSGTPGFPSGF